MYVIVNKFQSLIWSLLGAILLICQSCQSEDPEVLDPSIFGYDYYPIAIGKYWMYQTDSILYSLKSTVVVDTSRSFIREEVRDSFRDATNQLIYRLDVYHSRDSSQGWDLSGNFYVEANSLALNKRENGLTFVRLVFPAQRGTSWNGNVYIHPRTTILIGGESLEPFENWYYIYDYINKSDTILGRVYSNTCQVTEVDDENIIQKRYSIAKYAKGIGLIYKEQWLLDTQNTDTAIPFSKRAQKGMILTQRLLYSN
ncbi:MAG: hypothetical protein IPM92_03085 [Saprospiraceae bacterium]|nr:hypothetical protein [Saprospiraceae bacterium]